MATAGGALCGLRPCRTLTSYPMNSYRGVTTSCYYQTPKTNSVIFRSFPLNSKSQMLRASTLGSGTSAHPGDQVFKMRLGVMEKFGTERYGFWAFVSNTW